MNHKHIYKYMGIVCVWGGGGGELESRSDSILIKKFQRMGSTLGQRLDRLTRRLIAK